ncbi:MAG: SGNH/GDSL hydrolase family protein, partial [Ruminococcus sp.]|nr:SGNH/GDSL hydrolase family protein [Ruminococcus sp.]
MKKFLSLATATIMAMSFTACNADNPGNEKNSVPSAYQDISQPAKSKSNDTLFGTYVSNTVISTGCNSAVDEAQSVTYRAYFPVEEYGQLEYCFYFSNNVDSTYKIGKKEYTIRKGGEYSIESARIGTVSSADIDGEITGYCDVTFNGAKEKSVASGETFWSDPVTYNVAEDNYLVWEWTLTGTDIPAINMSELTKTGADHG